MRVRHSLCSAFLVSLVAFAQVTAAPPSAEAPVGHVSMRVSDSGVPTVSVMLNGQGPFVLVVDTGSNRTAVTARVVARLKAAPVASTALFSSTASSTGSVIRIEEVRVGSVSRRGLLAAVLPTAPDAGTGRDADGLLGQDFFVNENYTLDYARGRLAWSTELTSDARAVRLALQPDEGRWLVALPQDAGGDPLWFVPDSGAQALVVFDRGTPQRLALTHVGSIRVSTVTGTSRARTSFVEQLRVGSLILRDHPAVVIERRDPDAPKGDGLLPLSTFARVTFLTAERQLVVRAR